MRYSKAKMTPTREALARWPGLESCTPRELDELSLVIDEMSFDSGRVLMQQGAPAAEAFMILEGTVEVTIDGEVVSTLGEGRFVGEMALLENDVRTATVTVVEPVKALVLSRRAFHAVMGKPYVGERIATELAHRVRALEAGAGARD